MGALRQEGEDVSCADEIVGFLSTRRDGATLGEIVDATGIRRFRVSLALIRLISSGQVMQQKTADSWRYYAPSGAIIPQ